LLMVWEKFIGRENTIFDVLNKFMDNKLDFVVVGGYGVSAYKHRFSVDADLVVKKENLPKFEKVLRDNKFKKTISKKLDNVYSSQFVRYSKEQDLPVSTDLLVGGVASRETGAAFSFELIDEHSERRKITGIEKEVTPKVPCREMLIVMKLHSGRLTDFRDVAALCKNCDLEVIRKTICRGDIKILAKNVRNFMKSLSDRAFVDSFKGVFVEKRFDLDIQEIDRLNEMLLKQFRGKQ
jgi:hypothetical protein